MATSRGASTSRCLYAFERRDHEEAVRLLGLQDHKVLSRDEPGLLYLSISNGCEGLLDVLKCMVMNINGHIMDEQYRDTDGQTVLHLAVKHIDVVKYLINQCNCDIMTPDKYGNTILHAAAREGSLDVMKYLINTHHYNLMTTNNREHIDIVKYLINECNSDIMATDEYGNTILHAAARQGLLDVMKYLINTHHYDPMTTNNREHIDIVKYLINECNSDIMATDEYGNTILHAAARQGLLDVMKYLINTCHCNLMTTNNRGRTALHRAINYIDVLKYLINQCNCDIMVTDKNGQTPLHYAANWGTPVVVEYFLSTGNCDPLAKDNKGRTPLQLAYSDTVFAVFKKFGDIKISHPIDSYVNVLLVGNPGAGKSTLSHVINDTAAGSIVLGFIRNVGGVVPCTAGIIPYKLQHRTMGNIILHDFA
uniref:Uncharacterized protein n=2 Tax=Amphimedon queenslandica TaxID=400682 RepID=A0A1X7T5F8_AMPQE